MTTILRYLVGRSVVSAITQTPASGPLALVTTPPMSLPLTATRIAAACAAALAPLGAASMRAIAAIKINPKTEHVKIIAEFQISFGILSPFPDDKQPRRRSQRRPLSKLPQLAVQIPP